MATENQSASTRRLRGLLCAALICVAPARGRAQDARADLSLLGQVREGDISRETEAPVNFYGDLGLRHRRVEAESFFRLQRDFGLDEGEADFYSGLARVPLPGVELTMGRQFLGEGPGGVYVADAGKVRIDPGGPIGATIFGGAPRYFEPTFGADVLSDDEILFGGNVFTTRLPSTRLSLGYLQHERAGDVLSQLVTGTVRRSFNSLPGVPMIYSSAAWDADHADLDEVSGGVDLVLPGARVLLNLEGGYYEPQDGGGVENVLDRREDTIFQLFSVSGMTQARAGLTWALSQSISILGDYSFQIYDSTPGNTVEGHLGSAGISWLPGGDGLEAVRVEYYLVDSNGGNVNGGRVSFRSDVYERLEFRVHMDVAYYEKQSNQSDTAVNGFLGIGYWFLPELLCEINMEGNRNERFDEDIRFGFVISYNLRHALPIPFGGSSSAAEDTQG